MINTSLYRRLAVVVALLLAVFAWLGCRLYEIQVTRHRELAGKSRRLTERTPRLEPWRGELRERNGKVLAISVPVKSVYLNTALCEQHVTEVAQTCSRLLRVPAGELAAALNAELRGAESGVARPRKPLLVRRNVSLAEWNALRGALTLENFGLDKPKLSASEQARLSRWRRSLLFADDVSVRCYPYGECLSHVLGFVSSQTNGYGLQGRYGLERTMDKTLAGQSGQCRSQQDAAGNELPLCRTRYQAPLDGANVILTVDLGLQQIVEEALASAFCNSQAQGASAILMDPRTFDILAVAASPNFNPQNPGASPSATWRNPGFTDMVEPGSTFKLISLAAALDLGLLNLDSGVYCEHGRFIVDGVTLHDHAPYGLLTLLQCFAKSSNIGFAKVALLLGPERFYHYAASFGFGQYTGAPFVAEAQGRLERPQALSRIKLARAAFGQGISVSQLQMAVAMCVIANDGKLMRPRLVGRLESPQGQILQRFPPEFVRRVISARAAQQVREALQAVVSPEGTGAQAALADYTIALKTGTAQKADAHGYLQDRYYSSMVGFFPATAPQFVLAVALDEPRNGYYAGTVVAPVFRSIAEKTLARCDVPPDKPAHPVAPATVAAASRSGPPRVSNGGRIQAATLTRQPAKNAKTGPAVVPARRVPATNPLSQPMLVAGQTPRYSKAPAFSGVAAPTQTFAALTRP